MRKRNYNNVRIYQRKMKPIGTFAKFKSHERKRTLHFIREKRRAILPLTRDNLITLVTEGISFSFFPFLSEDSS